LAESVNGLYKTECIALRGPFRDTAEVEIATAVWVEFYCKRRLHGSLDRMTPDEFEAAYWTSQSDSPSGINEG
jgi:putative transposase